MTKITSSFISIFWAKIQPVIRPFFLLLPLVLSLFCCTEPTSVPLSQQESTKVSTQVSEKHTPASETIVPEIDSSFTLDYLRGRFNPAKHPDFVKVDAKYTDGDPYRLHKETYAAFEHMHAAAKADGIDLVMVSATRNFDRQRSIWEAKWTGKRLVDGGENLAKTTPDPKARALRILRWSSMPGTSRHHWGTDIDLNDLENAYFESGKGLKVYEWLPAHAAEYGFCQPYSPKGEGGRPHGYNEEKWHWSYLPLALQLTELAKTQLSDEEISGFEGSETAPMIGVVEKYVLGINPACL